MLLIWIRRKRGQLQHVLLLLLLFLRVDRLPDSLCSYKWLKKPEMDSISSKRDCGLLDSLKNSKSVCTFKNSDFKQPPFPQ